MHRDVHGSGHLFPRTLRRRGGSDDGGVRRRSGRDHRSRGRGNPRSLEGHQGRTGHGYRLPVSRTDNTEEQGVNHLTVSYTDLLAYLRARFGVEEGQTMAEYGVVLAV